uniref:Immunoglobulin I-set domain-containing protein n=1 Tax=Gopherus agassizii TaxID=38772 RepID=A0A452HCE6_9SAUR
MYWSIRRSGYSPTKAHAPIHLLVYKVAVLFFLYSSANEAPKVYGIQNGSEITWLKNSLCLTKGKDSYVKYYKDRRKYEMFPNGTLKIDCLVEEDSANYKVAVYNGMGSLQVEKNLIPSVQGESPSTSLPP